MKKNIFILITIVTAFILNGCSSDIGNYNYSSLMDLTITLPSENYNVQIGKQLDIRPTIATDIPVSDISYTWEVYGLPTSGSLNNNYYTFIQFATGKDLSYICNLTTLMPAPGNYTLRLHITQISTGRNFYSDNIALTITGVTGLMVLHGDDNQSDVGLVMSSEFLVRSGTANTAIYPAWYSQINGEKIQGKGISIVQSISSYLISYNKVDRCLVVAITDKCAILGAYANLKKYGVWNDFFYGGLNHNKPQFYSISDKGQEVYAVDDGILFARSAYSYDMFINPATDNTYQVASPIRTAINGRVIEDFFFDGKSRGFIGLKSVIYNQNRQIFPINSSSPFNPGNMNADLLYLDRGGVSGHFMAVMKDDSGNKFLAEMNMNATSMGSVPIAKYDMSNLVNIDNAKIYSFGDNQVNMCYYATPSAVYRYTAMNGDAITGEQLTYTDGKSVSFSGEITMMKVLKPTMTFSASEFQYYNYSKILLVGTYGGSKGSGVLYSLTLDQSTGKVLSINKYEGFDKIYDANIKGI